MFERATISPDRASSLLPKPENFYLASPLELKLYFPNKLNLGTPAFNPEKLLTDKKWKKECEAGSSHAMRKGHLYQSRAHFL